MSAPTVYCTSTSIKSRLLIKSTDTSMDADITEAISEASRIVDIFMKPYATAIPLEGEDLTDQIAIITADFTASIFKRRWVPNESNVRGNTGLDMINDVDGSGWFAVGLKRIQDYIKAFYTLETSISAVINPVIYSDLMKKGVITPKEARDLMVDDSLAITKKLSEIYSKQITLTEINDISNIKTDTITKDETLTKTQDDHITKDEALTKTESKDITDVKDITETTYLTKKQNSFVFISGDETTQGYKEDE
jgi:hypothetical protein